MALVLVAATAKELQAALAQLVTKDALPALDAPGKDYALHLAGKDCFLLVCGVGPVAAALNLGRCLERLHARGETIHAVLGLGIAGTYTPELAPVGTVLAPVLEFWPEYGLRSQDTVTLQGFAFPQLTDMLGDIWRDIRLDPVATCNKAGLCYPPSVAPAYAITVAGVSATATQAQHNNTMLRAALPDILAAKLAAEKTFSTGALPSGAEPVIESMEGFAWALACRSLYTPHMQLRAVSNIAGQRENWNIPLALHNLATALSLSFLQNDTHATTF